jgi:pyruvate dehydrogenase E2 component (dihydrolipoamide acetyltransferase)
VAVVEFRLPDLGEGLTEARIVSWAVAVGDEVALDAPLGELETDKATTEIPSPVAGRIVELAGRPGDVVAVGAVLVRFDDGTSVAPSIPPPQTSAALLVGTGAAPDTAPVRRRRPVAGVPPTRGLAVPALPVVPVRHAGFAIPSHLEPLEGYRAVAAPRLLRSRQGIPDAGASLLADVSSLDTPAAGQATPASPVTPFIVILKAVVDTLAAHPRINATFDDASGGVRIFDRIDLAVAVDTPLGLAVPVVTDAGPLPVAELAQRVHDLAEAARQHRLTPAEAAGGTFTVTNHGRFGTDDGYPIINPPGAAILAVGRIALRPVVVDGAVVARNTAPLTLVFDHRVIDGADAARFLTDLASRLA